MNTLLGIILIICLIICLIMLTIVLPYLIIRNNRVHRFRTELLNKVSEKSKQDVDVDEDEDKDWEWRYDAFEEVTYEEMLYSLKKLKVENYYKDTKFIE